jgi:N-sulfoglucosamine sulfohydrolase
VIGVLRSMRACALALLAVAAAPAATAAAARPNILWIIAEDMNLELGSYGAPDARTPELDRLAAEGARFTNAFATAPVCAPARSTLATGLFATTLGSHHMRSQVVPPPEVRLFSEYLRAAGYYTSNNAKTDYNFAPVQAPPPVTAWDESGPGAHWRKRAPGQPFFAVFTLLTTHESRIRYPPDEFALVTAGLRPEDRHDPRRAEIPPYYPDTEAVRRDWANYQDLVSAMDLQAGELLRQLAEDGLEDETVVFFFGDNGRGLPRAKRWLYDAGLHMPLIVRWPGRLQPGAVREDLVSFVDFAKTVLALAGVPAPPQLQGRAFLGEHAEPEPAFVFATRDRMDEAYDRSRAVRDRRFEYIRNFHPDRPWAQHIAYMEEMPTMQELRRLWSAAVRDGRPVAPSPQWAFMLPSKPAEELYDTDADPHEVTNLAADPRHRETLERMRRALEDWMRDTHDLGGVPEAEMLERMRPGGVWATTAAPVPDVQRAGGRTLLSLTSSTPGASLAWTVEQGASAHWQLYRGPFELRGPQRLRARACRLGYRDSADVVLEIPAAD